MLHCDWPSHIPDGNVILIRSSNMSYSCQTLFWGRTWGSGNETRVKMAFQCTHTMPPSLHRGSTDSLINGGRHYGHHHCSFSLSYACNTLAFLSIRRNELRDLTAELRFSVSATSPLSSAVLAGLRHRLYYYVHSTFKRGPTMLQNYRCLALRRSAISA